MFSVYIIMYVCVSFTSTFAANPPTNSPKMPWIPALINHGLENFVPRGKSPNSLCSTHGRLYEQHLRNLTLWAVQMVDASSTGPSGILTGNSYQFGDFDECINVQELNYGIQGKYLVVKFTFWPANSTENVFIRDMKRVFEYPSPDASAWEVFKATMDRRIMDRNVIHWAVCVPDSCDDDEVITSLLSTITPISSQFDVKINASVETAFTYSKRAYTETEETAFRIFLAVTIIMVIMVLTATVRELKYGESSIPNTKFSCLEGMSIITNWRKLMNCESQEFSSISGMKGMSMIMIIYGHRWMISSFSPKFNQGENEMLVGNLMYTLVNNGALVVNTFLVVTGFLTYYKILRDVENKKSINVFRYIYHRWIRITPLYAYVMAFTVVIYPRLSTGGPLGRSVIWDSRCTSSAAWWTQLLYINNYMLPTEQCLIPSWYLATDMQLYVVCAICGYVLTVHRPTGIALLYALTISSIVLPGIVVFHKNYSGVYLFYFDDFRTLLGTTEFVETYFYAHNRASPYIIGMLAGYFYYHVKSNKLSFSKFFVWTTVITATVVHFLTWLGAWFFYLPERPYSLIEHVSYAVFHRMGWSLAICVYIICDKLAYIGPLKQTIGARIYRPISTLSYAALLIHSPIQLLLAGLQRSPPYYNNILLVWMACGDIAFSYLAALLLHLFIEAPFSKLKDLRIQHFFDIFVDKKQQPACKSSSE